ncbi:hypothetical protein MCEMRH37_00029 [Candidatus Nanopelagicaceae bacterium]
MTLKIVIAGTANNGLSGIGTCPTLEKAFLDLGFELGNLEDSQVLVNLNHNSSAVEKFRRSPIPNKLQFLIALEPISVFPAQYSKKVLNSYNYRFYPGNVRRQESSSEILGWPYLFNENPAAPKPIELPLIEYLTEVFSEQIFDFDRWSGRKNFLTMIAANKVSPTNENLYGLRRKIASSLSPEVLRLYGPLWADPLPVQVRHRLGVFAFCLKSHYLPNFFSLFGELGKRYPCALGSIKDKHSVLRNSKFSLVIENSSENITEKLFDSLINGAIPIYIGPNLETSGIPEGVAIQGLRDSESISDYLQVISEEEIRQHLVAITNFLKSPNFLNIWENESVFGRIAREISMRVLAQV